MSEGDITSTRQDWLKAFYQEALADIRWAKERAGQIVQWSVLLLGGITAVSRSVESLGPWPFIIFAGIVGIGATWWLADLHIFARRTRLRLDDVLHDAPEEGRYPVKRTQDRHHIKYLVLQAFVIIATCALVMWVILTQAASDATPPLRPATSPAVSTPLPMQPTTLYYLFSTIAQSVAAIAAVLSAFIVFRIQSLGRTLVGHGQSALNRWGEKGYHFPDTTENDKYRKRLKDAIARDSVPEIKDVIRRLADLEKSEGFTRDDRPGGLQNLYADRFCPTEERIRQLRRGALELIGVSFIAILFSVVALVFTEVIVGSVAGLIVVWSSIVLLVVVLGRSMVLAARGLDS